MKPGNPTTGLAAASEFEEVRYPQSMSFKGQQHFVSCAHAAEEDLARLQIEGYSHTTSR